MFRLTYTDQFYLRALLLFLLMLTTLVSRSQSVQVVADSSLKPTGVRNLFVGKNYRNEWTHPVTVPVLKLSDAHLKPTKEGGGKQTRSLKVEDPNGVEYSLRSIKKYPEKAVPVELQKTLAESIVKDAISASYPYGSLSMGIISDAAGVPHLRQKLVFVSDDPALGKFRDKYKNMLAVMEDAKPSGPGIKNKNEIETYDTEEIVLKLQESNKNRVDQLEILKARLVDNFVMDFDRHEGQWKWMKKDSDDGNVYVAIPKDHDQAFFTNQGLITKIAKGFIPEIQGFRKKAKDQVTFNRAAINFDNFFLNQLNENEWKVSIAKFLSQMTDEVISSALAQQPKAIQQFDAADIEKKLKARRKYFERDMMKYYRHLSKVVSITGSNEPEDFQIYTNEEGKVLVTVRGVDGTARYERVFDPEVTKEIRLYGLEGNDQFQLEGGKSKIRIRLIGGPGRDRFVNNAQEKPRVYDVDVDQNSIAGTEPIKNEISGNPMNNEYERLGYKFDKQGFGIYSKYEFDGGVYFGPSYRIVKQGFRKEPYAAKHEIVLARTLALNSYLLRYNGELIKAIGKNDVVIRSEYFSPTSRTNFFGLGNESVFDESSAGGVKYYRARYDLANVSALMRTNLRPWMNLSYGPTFQYFQLRREENEGKFISKLDHTTTDDTQLYQSNFFAGGEAQFNINTTNDRFIPTRGALINTTVRTLVPLKGSASTLTQLSSSLAFYSDFLAADKLVFASRFGFTHNFGDYQFQQAQYLGFRENLRGYRLRRFAGRTSTFNNTELRWKVADLNLYVFRAPFGMLAFNDVGRVWADNENSSIWHDGYGAGIWLVPMNKLVITATIAYSAEEKNFAMLNFGFQF